jgi:methylglutaconyl-CoA hydratase
MRTTTTAVRLDRDERGVVMVTLDGPTTRNALGAAAMATLDEALAAAFGDPASRVVCLTGTGPVFCSGADRAELGDARALERSSALLASILVRIDEAPVPVVCRVNGSAFGAGMALVAAADISVAAAGGLFAVPEVRFGLVGGPAAAACARRLGVADMLDVFLTGRRFDANEAARVRLVTYTVAPEKLDRTVEDLLAELLLGEREAMRRTRRTVRGMAGPVLAQRLAAAGGG